MKKTVCEHCHKEITYQNEDLHQETHQIEKLCVVDYYYVICPDCKEKINLNRLEL